MAASDLTSVYSRVIDGQAVLVDAKDALLLDAHRWRYAQARGKFYVRRYCKINGKSKTIYLHRLVAAPIPANMVVDHINGDTLDNRACNLRHVTVAENCQNLQRAKTTSKTGVIGVNWHKKTKKWRAQIRLNRATIHIGYFDSIKSASAAYLAKKRDLHPASGL